MSAPNFTRALLRGRGARWGPAVLTAALVTALAAVRALDPTVAESSAAREVGAGLTLGVLVLAACSSAGDTRRILRVRRSRGRLALLAATAWRTSARSLLAAGLSLPAVVMAWEGGATAAQLGSLAVTLATAIASGVVLGSALAVVGLRAPAAGAVAVAAAMWLLWPATLGWADGLARHYPAVEGPPWLVLAVVVAAAMIGVTRVVAPAGIRP